MEIAAYARRARAHSRLLQDALDHDHPQFRDVLDEQGARAAIEGVLGLRVTVVDSVPSGCSVAGSSDPRTGAITLVRAGATRMAFTALHELGHVLGYTDIAFQEALAAAPGAGRRDVEEDACEAFAADLLLPPALVDEVLRPSGVSARGVARLAGLGRGSREASAVAAAHRMPAPGYVAIADTTGQLQFAARSGDVLPLRRGTDQAGSVVRHLLGGRTLFRGRGQLQFASGAPTDEMHVDAVVDEVIYLVAMTDSAPWLKASGAPAPVPTRAWCERCGRPFPGGRLCATCGDPIHAECGTCRCGTAVRTPQRLCQGCFIERPIIMFSTSATHCSECTD